MFVHSVCEEHTPSEACDSGLQLAGMETGDLNGNELRQRIRRGVSQRWFIDKQRDDPPDSSAPANDTFICSGISRLCFVLARLDI